MSDMIKLLEEGIVKAVAKELEKRMTLTDLGLQYVDAHPVYITEFSIIIKATSQIPEEKLRDKKNVNIIRSAQDKETIISLAKGLLGFHTPEGGGDVK